MVRRYLETRAASLAIKGTQIQPALRFHFNPVIIKKTHGNLEGRRRKRNAYTLLMGIKTGATTMENSYGPVMALLIH